MDGLRKLKSQYWIDPVQAFSFLSTNPEQSCILNNHFYQGLIFILKENVFIATLSFGP